MALSTNIYAEVTTTFPASVTGSGAIVVTKSGGVYTIIYDGTGVPVNSVGNDKMVQVAAQRLIGNPTSSEADRSEISLGSDLEFSGTALQGAALTGDVTKSAGSTTTAIAPGAVGTAEIATDAVTANEIATDAVTADGIAAGAVGTSELAAGAVTGAEIADDSVDSEHYVAASIDHEHLADDAISGATDRTAFASGDKLLIFETGVGLRKIDFDDLPAGGSSALPRSYLSGLGISNNSTDANNDIDFAIGECRDDADSEDIKLTSALTKRLDANWVVGTNQGGLDTGSKAISTWYYPWAIKRTDTGVVDVVFSLSKTSPTMPASYDKKRRIRGAVRTDSAGNIWAFSKRSGQFLYDVGVTDINTTGLGTSAILYAVTAPPDFDAITNTRLYHATNAGILITSPYDTDSAPNQSGFSHLSTASGSDSTRGEFTRRVNASSQLRLRSTASATNILLNTLGFIDPDDD